MGIQCCASPEDEKKTVVIVCMMPSSRKINGKSYTSSDIVKLVVIIQRMFRKWRKKAAAFNHYESLIPIELKTKFPQLCSRSSKIWDTFMKYGCFEYLSE